MMICRVVGSIVCSCRIDGLKHTIFRLVESESGLQQAADGGRKSGGGFLTTGTAARFATGDYEVLTDLAVCGVIDQWPPASTPN